MRRCWPLAQSQQQSGILRLVIAKSTRSRRIANFAFPSVTPVCPRRSQFIATERDSGGEGLGTELAAAGGEGNLGQALGAGLVGDGGWALDLRKEIVERQDNEEVDDARDDEEVDQGVEEAAVFDGCAVEAGCQAGEVRGVNRGGDELHDDVFGQRGDNRAEGYTNDDGDGEIDDVAAEDEVTKSLEHEAVSWRSALYRTDRSRLVPVRGV